MKPALLLASALVVGGLLVPATPAQAVSSDHVGVVFAKGHTLYRANPDLSGAVAIAALPDDIAQLSASADGSRVAYATHSYEGAGSSSLHRTHVAVLNNGGRLLRTLSNAAATFGYRYATGVQTLSPTLSADGSRAYLTKRVYTGLDNQASVASAPRRAVAGASTTVDVDLEGLHEVNELPSGRLLALDSSNHLITTDANGGDRRRATGLTSYVQYMSVSPDGTKLLAWTGARQARVLPLSFHDRDVSVGAPVDITDETTAPAWSADGATVYYARETYNQATSSYHYDLWSVPATGGAPTRLTSTDDPTPMAAVGVRWDDSAPAAATAYGPLLGSSTTVRWGLPADSDIGGVTVTRTAEGKPTDSRFVPAAATSYVDDRLEFGVDYTYAFRTEDRSGNLGPVSTVHMIGTEDHLGLGGGTNPFLVYVPASDHYRLDWSDLTRTPFAPWPVSHGGHYFGREGGTTVQTGHTYALRYQAFDSYGNASLPVIQRVTIAYDDTDLTIKGPSARIGGAQLHDHGETVLRSGSSATVNARGSYITLILTTCPTCGNINLLVYGSHVRGISTYSPTRRDGVRVRIPRSVYDGDITLIAMPASPTRRDVAIDAIVTPL